MRRLNMTAAAQRWTKLSARPELGRPSRPRRPRRERTNSQGALDTEFSRHSHARTKTSSACAHFSPRHGRPWACRAAARARPGRPRGGLGAHDHACLYCSLPSAPPSWPPANSHTQVVAVLEGFWEAQCRSVALRMAAAAPQLLANGASRSGWRGQLMLCRRERGAKGQPIEQGD